MPGIKRPPRPRWPRASKGDSMNNSPTLTTTNGQSRHGPKNQSFHPNMGIPRVNINARPPIKTSSVPTRIENDLFISHSF